MGSSHRALPGPQASPNQSQRLLETGASRHTSAFTQTAKKVGGHAVSKRNHTKAQEKRTGILIQSSEGALYLYDTSFTSFCDLAMRLLRKESGSEYFIDFRSVNAKPPREYPIDFNAGESAYKANILPRLEARGVEARVRSDSCSRMESFEPDYLSSIDLKMIAHKIGYAYCYAGWHMPKHLDQNSGLFVDALNLLFPQSPEDDQINELTVDIPRYGSYNVDRSLVPALSIDLQEILSRITGLEGQQHNPTPADGVPPAKIFVSKTNLTSPTQPVGSDADHAFVNADVTRKSQQEQLESEEIGENEAQRERLSQQSRDEEPHQHSRILPESVDKTASGPIQLPRYRQSLPREIRGGPDFPSVFPRVLALSEIEDLQRRLRLRENELLRREKYCRVCDMTFRHGSYEVEEHYQQHRLRQLYPSRQQDRRECPSDGCSEDLANVINFPELRHTLEHLQSHVQPNTVTSATGPRPQTPNVCSCQGCHADLNLLDTQQQEEHHGTHAPSKPHGKANDIETHNEHRNSGLPPASPKTAPASTKTYCNICLLCMQSLSQKRRHDHAEAKCQTSVKEFLQLTPAEAKERKAAIKASEAEQARNKGTDDMDEELTSSDAGRNRKRKPAAKATPTPMKRSRKK